MDDCGATQSVDRPEEFYQIVYFIMFKDCQCSKLKVILVFLVMSSLVDFIRLTFLVLLELFDEKHFFSGVY